MAEPEGPAIWDLATLKELARRLNLRKEKADFPDAFAELFGGGISPDKIAAAMIDMCPGMITPEAHIAIAISKRFPEVKQAQAIALETIVELRRREAA